MRYLKFYDLPVNIYSEKQWSDRGYKLTEKAKAYAHCEGKYGDYPVFAHTEVMPIKSERAEAARWKFDFDNVMIDVKKMARAYADRHETLIDDDLACDCCEVTDREWFNLWGDRLALKPTEQNFMQSNWMQWAREIWNEAHTMFFDKELEEHRLNYASNTIRPDVIPAGYHDKFGWMARGYRVAQPEDTGVHVLDYDGKTFKVYSFADCVEMWGEFGLQRRHVYHGTLRNLERKQARITEVDNA